MAVCLALGDPSTGPTSALKWTEAEAAALNLIFGGVSSVGADELPNQVASNTF
jgi:hypothetical protein